MPRDAQERAWVTGLFDAKAGVSRLDDDRARQLRTRRRDRAAALADDVDLQRLRVVEPRQRGDQRQHGLLFGGVGVGGRVDRDLLEDRRQEAGDRGGRRLDPGERGRQIAEGQLLQWSAELIGAVDGADGERQVDRRGANPRRRDVDVEGVTTAAAPAGGRLTEARSFPSPSSTSRYPAPMFIGRWNTPVRRDALSPNGTGTLKLVLLLGPRKTSSASPRVGQAIVTPAPSAEAGRRAPHAPGRQPNRRPEPGKSESPRAPLDPGLGVAVEWVARLISPGARYSTFGLFEQRNRNEFAGLYRRTPSADALFGGRRTACRHLDIS